MAKAIITGGGIKSMKLKIGTLPSCVIKDVILKNPVMEAPTAPIQKPRVSTYHNMFLILIFY